MDEKLKRMKSQPNPIRAVGTSSSGNPLYRGLGIVFGGRDLYGETFSKPREMLTGDDPELKIGTQYFLSQIADEVDYETGDIKGALWEPVHWDHGLGNLGGKRLGKAAPVKITDEGIEYLIEVEQRRAEDYQQMIDYFQNNGWLGLSTQTLPSFADFDWSSAEIKGWYPAELSFTVTPAEHRTREGIEPVRSLFKKYGIEVEKMKKTAEENVQDGVAEEIETADAVVDELLNGLSEQVDEETEMLEENHMLSVVLRSLQDFQDTVLQRLDVMDGQIAKMASADELQAMRTELVKAFSKGLEGLGPILTKAVRTRATEVVQTSSDFEIAAMRNMGVQDVGTAQTTRSRYGLPPNAPGQN